ncbi:MAG: YitT family protein, partial [Oscillospiraceae bacterium]|nr:YitT family protein [Oscillospiraceae bacterium]
MEKKKTFKDHAIWFLLLNAGLIVTAAGISFFKTPNNFAMGGTSGLAIILASLFPQLNVGGSMFIINILLIILGYIFVGKSFAWATTYASLALSGFVSVFELIMPVDHPLTNDPLLELVWAVILPAVGSAIVFNIGASTGGTDIVAMILSKHTSLPIGKALLCADVLIVLATFWIYGIPTGLYCTLGLVTKTFLV